MGVFSDELQRRQQAEPQYPTGPQSGRELTSSEKVFGPRDQASYPAPLYRNIYDVTLGGLTYGGAGFLGSLAKGLPSVISDTDAMQAVASSMDKYRRENPEYSPIEVDNAWNLIKDPMAMSSRLFNGLPQIAAGVGAVAVPYVGVPLSAGMTAAVESSRSYEEAKQYGASEDEAVRAGRATGLSAGLLDTMLNARILAFSKGEQGWLARNSSSRVTRMLRAVKIPESVAGLATEAAVISSAQGAANEGIAAMTYGRDVKDEFWDRRIQEAIGGAATATVFGAVTHGVRKYLVVPTVDETGNVVKQTKLDAYDRDSYNEYLRNEVKMDPEPARHLSEVTDAFARNWASRNNQPVEAFYGKFVNGPADSTGANLTTAADSIPKLFHNSDPKVALRGFGELVQSVLAPSDVQILRDNGLNTTKQISDAFARYLGEGQAPAPELIEPFEFFKDTLKDVYRTVKDELKVQSVGDLRTLYDKAEGDVKLEMQARSIAPKGSQSYQEATTRLEAAEARWNKIRTQLESGQQLSEETIPGSLSPQLRSAFDRVLSIDTDQIAEARRKLYAGEADLLNLKTAIKADPTGPPEPGNLFRMGKTALEIKDEAVQAMHEDLRRLQLGRELPDRDSAVARRAAPNGMPREIIRNETPEQRIVRGRLQSALDSAEQFFADFSAPLTKFKSGQKILDILSDVLTHRRNINSQFEEENTRARLKLTKRDRDWMMEVDPVEAARTGIRINNMMRYMDKTGVPNPIDKAPSQAVADYLSQDIKINQTLGKMAMREGVVYENAEGQKVPYNQPADNHVRRFLTDDARAGLEAGKGNPIFDAIRNAVQKGAESVGEKSDLDTVAKNLKEFATQAGLRESGPLTDARKVRFFPTEVEVNGRIITTLHTNPDEYLQRNTRAQAFQLGWNRVAGVRDLEPVPSKQLKSLLEGIGVEPPRNVETLKKKILDLKGVELPAHIDDIKLVEEYAKQLEVDVRPKRSDYINQLDKLSILDFQTPQREAQLREAATQMEGIDPKAALANLLDEVKRRSKERLPDVIEVLKKNLAAEGGDVPLMMDAIRLAQGIPIYKSRRGEYRERQGFIRAAHFVGGVIGTAQTSTSAIPNLFQTLVQVPQMTGVANLVGAFDSVAKDYAGHRQQMITLGAITDTHMAWMLEHGYALEGITRNLRQAVQFGTGMKFLGDFNNVVAGEAFRRLALDWKSDPKSFGSGEVALARRLELTPAQISEIQSGKMSDFTFRKVVQNGVAKTQYVTESAHRRAIIENHPIWRMLAAYNSYGAGTLRSSLELLRSGMTAFRAKDTDGLIKFGGRTLALTAGALGAGVMSEMMRDVIRGNTSQDQNETLLSRGTAAALSIQLFGPPQRLLESIRYDTGSVSNWAVGLFPQVRAVADMLGLVYNAAAQAAGGEGKYGTYSKFGIGKQIQETAIRHTPLAKAFVNWFHDTAYPDEPVYNEIKANVAKWKTDVLKQEPDQSEYKLNPEYHDVWTWTKRNDPQMAMKAAQEYYSKFYRKVGEDPETFVAKGLNGNTARTNLRASLRARAPLNMPAQQIPLYLSSLPEDRRAKFLAQHAKYMAIVNSVAPASE